MGVKKRENESKGGENYGMHRRGAMTKEKETKA